MPLHILYVEDRERDCNILRDALEEGNRVRPYWAQVTLSRVRHPSELRDALTEGCATIVPPSSVGGLMKYPDVVLADVYFKPADGGDNAAETDHLNDIIVQVREWDKTSPHGFPTPVIAYTSKGAAALKKCLERRGDLLDIWDKMSAGSDYVAWRLQQLAVDLPRLRPDVTIQKLVAAMPERSCPRWHSHVLKLVKGYGDSQIEHEQVKKCRDSLQSILNAVCPKSAVALMALWDVLVNSEPLLRAASPKIRGIARHSINVFWLGYWIINNPLMADNMKALWTNMVDTRSDATLKAVSPMEGLNVVWLMASLFHDAGKFHEKGRLVTEASCRFSQQFASLALGTPSWSSGETTSLPTPLSEVLFSLKQQRDDPFVTQLEKYIQNSWSREAPDHGAVAAAHLVNICGDKEDPFTFAYAKEASRAVLMHSCLPCAFDAVPSDNTAKIPRINWKREPISGLLLFCDQIQTWDRDNPNDEQDSYPDRAELSFFELSGGPTEPILRGCINYIAPTRVDMYPDLRKTIAERLNKVLLERPKNTLLHVFEGGWPLTVHLDFTLGGEVLPIAMDFS